MKLRALVLLSFALFACGKTEKALVGELKAQAFKHTADEALKKMPAYRELAKHEPVVYARIKSGIEQTLRQGGDQHAVAAKARAEITQLIPRYIPTASDEALLRYMKATLNEIEEASRKDPAVAYAIMFPDPAKTFALTDYVSAAAIAEDMEALAQVIATGAKKEKRAVDEARVQQLIEEIVSDRLHPRFGDDLNVMQQGGQPGTDKAKFVKVSVALYREIFALPEADAAQVLRSILTRS